MPDQPEAENFTERATAFHMGAQHAKAKEALVQLRNKAGGRVDAKVVHNLALCEFLAQGRSPQAGQAVLKELNKLKRQALAAAEDGDDQQASQNHLADSSLISYNIAVLHLHFKRYSHALKDLQELHGKLDPLDDHLALCVCLTLADVYLAQHRVHAALDALEHVETTLSSIVAAARSSESSQPNNSENGNDGGDAEKDIALQPLSRFVSSVLLQSHESRGGSSVLVGDVMGALSLRKARIHLLLRQMKNSKKEIKAVATVSEDMGGSRWYGQYAAGVLKGNLELLRNNNKKAMRLLMALEPPSPARNHSAEEALPMCAYPLVGGSAAEAQAMMPVVHFNNLATALMRMHRYSAALELFAVALQECGARGSGQEAPTKPNLREQALDRRYEVLYNTGVCLLLAGNFAQASRCLLESAQLFSNSANLWLRVAECCVCHYTQSHPPCPGVVVSGEGRSRVLVLPRQPVCEQSGEAEAQLSPAFGIKCCRNAIALLEGAVQWEDGGDDDGKAGDEGGAKNHDSGKLDPDQSAAEIAELQTGFAMAHLNLAFLSLCLNDYHTALNSASAVLRFPFVKGDAAVSPPPPVCGLFLFFAHAYVAHASLRLGRTEPALANLTSCLHHTPHLPVELGGEAPPDQQHAPGMPEHLVWLPDAIPPHAKATVLANLAVAYALKGDAQKAEHTAQRAVDLDSRLFHARLSQAFVLLTNGNKREAIQALERGGTAMPPPLKSPA